MLLRIRWSSEGGQGRNKAFRHWWCRQPSFRHKTVAAAPQPQKSAQTCKLVPRRISPHAYNTHTHTHTHHTIQHTTPTHPPTHTHTPHNTTHHTHPPAHPPSHTQCHTHKNARTYARTHANARAHTRTVHLSSSEMRSNVGNDKSVGGQLKPYRR